MKAFRHPGLRSGISLLVILFSLSACRIDPPLHLRKIVEVEVELEAQVDVDVMWQIDWEMEWEYNWNVDAYGPVGYEMPVGMRLHTYTHDANGDIASHDVHNFAGEETRIRLVAGTYDFLFHSNDSESILFSSDGEINDVYAYTRVISSGLQESSFVRSLRQKIASAQASQTATKAVETRAFDSDPVVLMPDELYSLYTPNAEVTDNPDDYELIDGHYIYRVNGEMHPSSFIYLIQIHLLNNNGRVIGSAGGAAITGLAEGVDLRTQVTSTKTVCVPMDVRINRAEDPDLLGARLISFGIPGCNPYEEASVAAAPSSHYFVLSIAYNNGGYKNIHVDVTDQVRALPTGGVISLDLDVNDFPPEEAQPGTGGGFNALIGTWDEQEGGYTITY